MANFRAQVGRFANRRTGGSRRLGRNYFFLAEPLLLELDLLALLLEPELELPLFFEPPELVLDFAMITLLCRVQNRRGEITVTTQRFS